MFYKFLQTTILAFFCLLNAMDGQSDLVHEYKMDDCTLNDNTGNLNGITFGLNCACGVSTNGLLFNGSSGFAQFGGGLNELFKSNWTLSFYLKINNQGTESVDILFLGERCGLDSILSLRYLPGTQILRLILSDSPNNGIQVDANFDDNSCWQYVTITKQRAIVRLYINGVLEEEDAGRSDLVLNVDGIMSISNSPCQNISNNADVKFNGVIDEFRIYNRALTAREIGDSYLQPDKIITNDTTIFKGSSIRLMTGGSCSEEFVWSPTTYLDDPLQLNPVTTPTEDIIYTLTVNGNNCQSVDQVRVRVADQSIVTCTDLLLPNAFTPNNDRINDVYAISNQFLVSSLQSFEIFNRWGGRVFFTNDITGSWDGTYKGEPAPPTSYVYKIVYMCENQVYNKTGSVNLIR